MTFEPIPVPLREDEDGAIRIGDTRVLLDLVIHEFRNGATPEGLVESYDSLNLADVYTVLSHYLRHTKAIDGYLRPRDQQAQTLRAQIESSQPPRPNLRAVLMARAKAKEQQN